MLIDYYASKIKYQWIVDGVDIRGRENMTIPDMIFYYELEDYLFDYLNNNGLLKFNKIKKALYYKGEVPFEIKTIDGTKRLERK